MLVALLRAFTPNPGFVQLKEAATLSLLSRDLSFGRHAAADAMFHRTTATALILR